MVYMCLYHNYIFSRLCSKPFSSKTKLTRIFNKSDYLRLKLAMKSIFFIIRMAVVLLLVINCSNSDPSQPPRSPDLSSGNQPDKKLRILFRWPGDDFATKQQLETRDKIRRLISERQIGKAIQSGTGQGWMDIIIEVKERENAQEQIEKIIKEISPDARFTILVVK